MKCYTHPDKDAVAVCSVCGQGICEPCSVKIGGKFYCKQDADRLFGTVPITPEARPAQAPVPITPEARVSSAWYLLPFFLGIIGGLIAWVINKESDPKKARNFLIFGVVWTIVLIVGYIVVVFLVFFALPPLPLPLY